jgi:hypothetical protein
MDAEAIQSVLEAGTIGEMPYSHWLEQVGRVLSLDNPTWMGKPVSKSLSELGVEALRWESGHSNPDEQRLWQAFLVATLPATLEGSGPTLSLLDEIAVQTCGSFFYFLRGRELWIEYLVAQPEVRDAIEVTMREGTIGELPFPMWFRYNPASTSIEMMSGILAAYGVTAVRWEHDEYERRMGIKWQAYLVATLPLSATVAPPSLPSNGLVSALCIALRQPDGYFITTVRENTVELWASYNIGLPLEEPPGELVIENGLTYISFGTPRARKQRARQLRQGLWRAARDLLKHYARR